jgi:hypothetical protein
MSQIRITRAGSRVQFEEISLDPTGTFFFTNLDGQTAHWPTLIDNKLGPAPSPNSSEAIVPPADAAGLPSAICYGCRMPGHQQERGIIYVFAQLAAAVTAPPGVSLGLPISDWRVVQGGKSPYAISDQVFQIVDNNGKVIQAGQGSVGPGLQLLSLQNHAGVAVVGAPTQVGKYQFTFTVNDASGQNLQQVQYSLQVSAPPTAV